MRAKLHRWSTGTAAALLTAMAVVIAGCGERATASPTGAGTPSDTPSLSAAAQVASETPAPTSSPSMRPIAADTLVQTVGARLSVREAPSLSAARVGIMPVGLRAWVVAGPVKADGYQWYRLIGTYTRDRSAPGCADADPADLSCAWPWIGWAAGIAVNGDVWLTAASMNCPTARDTATFFSLTADERLFCAGNEPWQLDVEIVPEPPYPACAPDWAVDPPWMDWPCHWAVVQSVESQDTHNARVDAFTPPSVTSWWDQLKGQAIALTGHLADPAARSCRAYRNPVVGDQDIPPPPDPDLVVYQCRLEFVVDSASTGQ